MKYLFWNTNKQYINEYIEKLAIKNRYDIIILAEYCDNVLGLLKSLECNGMRMYKIKTIGCKRITLLSKTKPASIIHCNETAYYTIKIIRMSNAEKQIIGAVHMPSKLHAEDEDRRIEISDMKANIEKLESKFRTNNTVLVGDFNANPFDGCMTKVTGLHSVSSRDVAYRIEREVKGRKYSMFYNPMWNKFGDFEGVAGTYYYSHSNSEEIFWNIFDQVIIRPQLIERFEQKNLNIITRVEEKSLLNGNNKIVISDHLPIEFSIMEE